MKKIVLIMLAVILTAMTLVACGNNDATANDTPVNDEVIEDEVILEEGWSYSPKMLVGAWDFQYEMTGEYYGYRFNEDGTLDELYNRMHIPMGYYKCEIDGVHYSPDGENWDELVMVVKSLTKDELVVDFGGMETVYKRYEGETEEYMPAGWQYVEGTDDEIGADVSAETDE